jgi:hypothetical protein
MIGLLLQHRAPSGPRTSLIAHTIQDISAPAGMAHVIPWSSTDQSIPVAARVKARIPKNDSPNISHVRTQRGAPWVQNESTMSPVTNPQIPMISMEMLRSAIQYS